MTTTLRHGTLCDESGVVGTEHGVDFEDVRCLSSWRLLVEGAPLLSLGAVPGASDRCDFFATNARSDRLPENKLVVRRCRTLAPVLRDELVIDSYADDAVTVEAVLRAGQRLRRRSHPVRLRDGTPAPPLPRALLRHRPRRRARVDGPPAHWRVDVG